MTIPEDRRQRKLAACAYIIEGLKVRRFEGLKSSTTLQPSNLPTLKTFVGWSSGWYCCGLRAGIWKRALVGSSVFKEWVERRLGRPQPSGPQRGHLSI